VALYNNQPPPKELKQKIDRIKDPESGAYVPFVKLPPKLIVRSTVKDVVADGFVTKVNPAGSALVYSSYVGGANSEVKIKT